MPAGETALDIQVDQGKHLRVVQIFYEVSALLPCLCCVLTVASCLWPACRQRNPRPQGKRALRVAIANFKGGAGKFTVALHFAPAAALDGYRVLAVDFDPQATLSHSMGLSDLAEEYTDYGIMARDFIYETERVNSSLRGAESGSAFIKPTCWPTIDIIACCANATFVKFASAQYRHLNPELSFFAAVSRFLDSLSHDSYE